ncbi:placenta-specific gene 8 protein-like [Plakobranchus ocellatus]|uniref:Placenta-specific gene 8 protein-like n=1 Tax=Plakobranchus ocellatus TaxID=259542 RepID=A0AAV4BAD8_9GAST|nr:placenta-specific gene 8 protein-like [Plakobranchus ocellatus]
MSISSGHTKASNYEMDADDGDGASKIVLRGSFSTNASHACLDEATNASLEENNDGPSHDQGDASLVISKQPGRKSAKVRAARAFATPFNDAHSDRDWSSGMCQCSGEGRSTAAQILCWPVYRYTLSTRLGETPFMPLIPCAAFALRIKVRTMFGIKGSIIGDFFASLLCEPCVVCQMTREMDHIGL